MGVNDLEIKLSSAVFLTGGSPVLPYPNGNNIHQVVSGFAKSDLDFLVCC